jgi:drug/metabolite transporter (DMT)-like permease
MTSRNARLGVLLMMLAMFIFATQDALSRHLAGQSNAVTVNWIRFVFFMAFVLVLAARQPGGLRAVLATRAPVLQVARGIALVAQLSLFVTAFTILGLAESHAVFAVYPLIVIALSALMLGERVPPARWAAVGLGFVGVLVLLRPGTGALRWEASLVLAGAFIFALYSVWTRKVAQSDNAVTSLCYVGLVGCAALSLAVPFYFVPLAGTDWAWMTLLCVLGVTAHGLLIKVYDLVEANVVQPIAYLQLLFATAYGIVLFGERPDAWTWTGMAMLVAAGLWATLLARRGTKLAPSKV